MLLFLLQVHFQERYGKFIFAVFGPAAILDAILNKKIAQSEFPPPQRILTPETPIINNQVKKKLLLSTQGSMKKRYLAP